jgi:hypothetical protein
MSTTGQAPLQASARGRAPRRPLAVPVMVTVLRPETAHSVTRRALNLGEGGIAISFALPDEVRVSDAVAVGFLLPDLGLGPQARAVVRYRTASQAAGHDGIADAEPVATRCQLFASRVIRNVRLLSDPVPESVFQPHDLIG